MKKRVLSALLALTLVLGLLPAAAPHVHAEEHICVDNDFNHHCDDVGCRQYIDCYDSELDDDDYCDICGACPDPVDTDGDNLCDFCGCCMAHTFENGYWHSEGGVHYPECDYCSYYNYAAGTACADGDDDGSCDDCGTCVGTHSYDLSESRDIEYHLLVCSICHSENWEEHFDNNTDAACDICGTCMEHDETKTYVWDEESLNDDDGHYLVCKDCGIGWNWEEHSDGDDEDSFCDVCGSCEIGAHGDEVWNEIDRDEEEHWSKCGICGAAFGWVEHSDEDGNGSCDVCCYCVDGEHSCVWDEEHWDSVEHRLVCKDCGMYCGWESHLDEDNDGSCDICGYEAHVHTYENGAYHVDSSYHYAMCDTCGHWDGLNCDSHTDEDSDCLCDVCEYSLHQFDELEDLENGTHQGVCTKCGETVTQDHVFDQTDWDAEGHWYACACGTAEAGGEKTAHVYEANNWYGHNGMHYPECDGCGYHQPEGEAHVDENDDEECDVCQFWVNAGVFPSLPDDTASKIIVLMADSFGDGWNGAAINIYENDVLAGTATVIFDEDDTASGYACVFEMPYDSAAEYRFVWVEGSYDDECTYKIYVNGEEYTDDLDTEEGTSGGGGVEGGETPASGSVTITGDPVVGQTLTAVASGFDSGEALTYQWYRVVEIRVPIDGATAPTYTLAEADLHWAIYCVVNGVESNHVGSVTAPTYDLWIGGVQVTSDNLVIDSADNAVITGTATYDPDTNTLTLNDYTYEGEGYTDDRCAYAIYYKEGDTLRLVLEGTNSVTQQSASAPITSYGIFSDGSITVLGDGSLTATGGEAALSSYGVCANGGTITLSGTGNLEAIGGEAALSSYGVNLGTNGSIIVSDTGSLTATGDTVTGEYGSSYGVMANYGTITVSGSGSLTATGGEAALGSYGVNLGTNGSIIVSDTGSLTATGDTVTGSNGSSCGVYANGGSITLSGGETIAQGATQAFCSAPTIDATLVVYDVGGAVIEDPVWTGEGVLTYAKIAEKPTTHTVSVSAADKASGSALNGATLKILDSNGDIWEEWVSETRVYTVTGLKTNETYTLKAVVAPAGYILPIDTEFTIDESSNVSSTGSVTEDGTLLVEFEKTTVKISAVDVDDGAALEGATLQILDSDGYIGEEWVSGTEVHMVTGLKTGVAYTIRATVAPDRYSLASDTTFSIHEDGKVITGGSMTEDGTLLVEFEKIPTYTITIGNFTNGKIESDKTTAGAGETVTLTIAPDAGYQLKSIRINGAENETVIGKTTVTFTMPAEDVDISATFAEGVVVYFDNTVSDWTNVICFDGNGYPTCIDLDNDLYGVIVPAGKTMSFTNYMLGMPESEYPEGYSTTVEFIPENGTTYSIETLRTIHVKTEGDRLTVSASSAEAGSPTDMILMVAGYRSNKQMVGCQVIEDVTGVTEETLTVTGDYIKVFFLKPGTYAPLFQSIML